MARSISSAAQRPNATSSSWNSSVLAVTVPALLPTAGRRNRWCCAGMSRPTSMPLSRPVEVRVRHLDRAGHERLERDAQVRDARDGERAHGRAVVRDVAADDLGALRLPDHAEVLAGELPGGLDRLGAARREEDAVEVAGGVARHPLGQLNGPGVGVRPQGEVGQRLGLLGARLGELGAAVADLRREQPRQPVEVALSVLVPDVGALAAHDHGHLVVLVGRPSG